MIGFVCLKVIFFHIFLPELSLESKVAWNRFEFFLKIPTNPYYSIVKYIGMAV
jgi:hypothetical protein